MRFSHFYKTFFPDTEKDFGQVVNQIVRGAEKQGVKTGVLSLTPDRMARIIEVDSYFVGGDGMLGIIV